MPGLGRVTREQLRVTSYGCGCEPSKLVKGGFGDGEGDRLPRLLKLIATIQNHPGLSAEELAGECGVGVRAVVRRVEDILNCIKEVKMVDLKGYGIGS